MENFVGQIQFGLIKNNQTLTKMIGKKLLENR